MAGDRSSDRVTTVVVTRDRWPDLQRSLPRHAGAVVLVDNASADGTPRRVREAFPDIHVIELRRNLGAVGRNVGVRAARTPYVAFADDDSWWAPGALERAAACLDARPRLALLAARILVGPDQRLDPTCVAMARSPLPREVDLPGPSVLGFLACGAVIRRSAFLSAGGFDEVVEFVGEEQRLALDLAARGWGLAYVADVVAHHHPSQVREQGSARVVREARNDVLTALMRRPWPIVVGTTWRTVIRGREGTLGVLQALPRTHRALLRRRRIPAAVEHRRRLLPG